MSTLTELSLQQVFDALLDVEKPFHARFMHRLSDLEPEELAMIKPVWFSLPSERRRMVVEGVKSLSASNYMLDFVAFSRIAVEDRDPEVRLHALKTLQDYERNDLIPLYLTLSKNDEDPRVRAAAARCLGQYVYSGEIEELPPDMLHKIEDHLLNLFQGNDEDSVRRAALESLGYSSRNEIHPIILEAFASSNKLWKASALMAMGRSANREYQSEVMSMLDNRLPAIRMEAARAAGELELAEAVPFLMELLDDPNEDIRKTSIWSLSEIGGDEVRDILEKLSERAEGDDELELLEAALENLSFSEGIKLMPMFELPEDDEDTDEWEDILDEEDVLLDLDDIQLDEEDDLLGEEVDPDD